MKENGKLCVIKNGSGVPCYYFRWWDFPPQPAVPVRRKREVGRVDSMTPEQAEEIIKPWRLAANARRPGPHNVRTMGDLIAHFRMMEIPIEAAEAPLEEPRRWKSPKRRPSLEGWEYIEPVQHHFADCICGFKLSRHCLDNSVKPSQFSKAKSNFRPNAPLCASFSVAETAAARFKLPTRSVRIWPSTRKCGSRRKSPSENGQEGRDK